jgi:hypothetical protein
LNDEKGCFCRVTPCTNPVSERSRWVGEKCGQFVFHHDAQRAPIEKKSRALPLEQNYSKEASFLGSKFIPNNSFLNLPELYHSLTFLCQLGIPSYLPILDIINTRWIIIILVCRLLEPHVSYWVCTKNYGLLAS